MQKTDKICKLYFAILKNLAFFPNKILHIPKNCSNFAASKKNINNQNLKNMKGLTLGILVNSIDEISRQICYLRGEKFSSSMNMLMTSLKLQQNEELYIGIKSNGKLVISYGLNYVEEDKPILKFHVSKNNNRYFVESFLIK